MGNNYFRPKLMELHQERNILADIHGNFSALSVALDDIHHKHMNRIGEALIDTIDISSDGGKMRKSVRHVFRDTRPDSDSKRQAAKLRVRDAINSEIDRLLPGLPKPKIFCLGDIVGYYGQSKECLNAVKSFDGVCIGNHGRAVREAKPTDTPELLMRWKGMGSYSANSTIAIRRQLTQDEIDYLNSLPDQIKIRGDTVGRHCHYHEGRAMYPISRKVATSEDYFSNTGNLGILCQEPEDIFDMDETFVGVDFELDSHVHIPLLNQFDENGKMIADLTPGNVKVGSENKRSLRNYFLARFTIPRGHKAKVGVGSIGISRRRDKSIIEAAEKMEREDGTVGYDLKQGYYVSLLGRKIEFREFYYDINLKGTLRATVDAGIELREEDVQDEQ